MFQDCLAVFRSSSLDTRGRKIGNWGKGIKCPLDRQFFVLVGKPFLDVEEFAPLRDCAPRHPRSSPTLPVGQRLTDAVVGVVLARLDCRVICPLVPPDHRDRQILAADDLPLRGSNLLQLLPHPQAEVFLRPLQAHLALPRVAAAATRVLGLQSFIL